MAQDRATLLNARERLVAHCHAVAERLAEGWRPWSPLDIDALVRVGKAIAVLDRLIKEERDSVSPFTPESSGP